MFKRARLDGDRVIRAVLNGSIVWRGFRYLYDDFLGTALNEDRWEIIDPKGTGNYSVSQSEYRIRNDSGDTTVSDDPLVGILSKQTFKVGTIARARVRNPLGRHTTLLGMAKSTPDSPGMHGGSVVGFSCYSREDNGTVVFSSYRDEDGQSSYTGVSSVSWMRSYSIIEIRWETPSTIRFYRDDVLQSTLTGVRFDGEYRVFFLADSWTLTAELDVDWVEVVGPLE